MDEIVYAGAPIAAGVILGLIGGRFWLLLIPLGLGLGTWISAGNDGDGEIPGWFLGGIVAGTVGIGVLLGLILSAHSRGRSAREQ